MLQNVVVQRPLAGIVGDERDVFGWPSSGPRSPPSAPNSFRPMLNG